jgi:hypothetical protein
MHTHLNEIIHVGAHTHMQNAHAGMPSVKLHHVPKIDYRRYTLPVARKYCRALSPFPGPLASFSSLSLFPVLFLLLSARPVRLSLSVVQLGETLVISLLV